MMWDPDFSEPAVDALDGEEDAVGEDEELEEELAREEDEDEEEELQANGEHGEPGEHAAEEIGIEQYTPTTVAVQPHVEDCITYDILPYVSAVHPCNIYSLAATKNMRWIFTGGDDGFIRKYDFAASIGGSLMLTQTQKHGLVDSIQKSHLEKY
ncbi:Transcription factor spt8 [Borealophlyctis nickersoniae]|nr:Transcription factor spt8 [Borealophlyctis nickersoniae]